MLRLSKYRKVFRELTAYLEGRNVSRYNTELESLWELRMYMRLKVHTVTAFPLACGGQSVP